jgi:MOSC domain-containing protein
MIRVARLSTAPVKSLGLSHPNRVRLERFGVAENRRFVLVTPDRELIDASRYGALMTVHSECDADGTRLKLLFPDGSVLEDDIELEGEPFAMDMWGRSLDVRLVAGAWSAALTEVAGGPMRLVRCERPGDGNDEYPVSVVSLASVAELGRRSGRDEEVDPARFRMLLELDGCVPHEEDRWLGLDVRVADALIRVADHDPRCSITTMNPDTGEVDYPTLKVIAAYRGVRGKHLNFGMYAEVLEPGTIRVGDAVIPLDEGVRPAVADQ